MEKILSRLDGVKKNGKGWTAHCPAHEDKNASLSVSKSETGKILFKCFAGCSFGSITESLGLTAGDAFPDNGNHAPTRKAASITVSDLAADKGIPSSDLETFGLKNTKGGVHIIYRLMDGADAPRQRLRTALSAGDGSIWMKGAGSPVPYGLDRLFDAREEGFIVLVEGESDCWTLWHHGIPALGIPGADMTGKIQSDYLTGIGTIYYVREPDAGGEAFAVGMRVRLSGLAYRGELREVKITGAKDPNALHKKDPVGFKATFQKALDTAAVVPLDKPKKVAVLEEPPEEITAFLDRKFEDAQEIIGNGLITRQSACLIRGWKKALKSWEGSQVAICAALGIPYHVFPVPRASRVLIVQAEISPARYQARLAMLLKAHAGRTGLQDALRGKIFVKNGAPKLDGDSFEILKGWIERIKPDLVILDPIYKFLRYADENSHSSMRLIFERLDEIKAMGCAIVIVHHNRKATMGESDTSKGVARGAGWEEWVDSIVALRRDNTDRWRVKLSFELRNAEEPDDIVISRDKTTMWGTVTEIAADRRQKITILDVRDALLSMGGKAGSKTELCQVLMDKYGISDRTAETRIDMAVEEGVILLGESGAGKRVGYRVHIPSISETLPYADN